MKLIGGEWSAAVLSFGGVQPVTMDLSSDTDSVEARSTASEGLNDSEREDECSGVSDDLPPAELEPDPPLMRPMRAGLPQLDMWI